MFEKPLNNYRHLFVSLLGAALLVACSDDSSEDDPLFPPSELSTQIDPFADTGTCLGILPPGSADANDGNINTNPNSSDQLAMYENLVFSDNYPSPGQLSDEDLTPRYFKDTAFLQINSFAAPQRVSDGTLTARIGRDDFGVPHIFGDSRAEVMFGTGYATATDRLFLIDVVRHIGRGRMSDFLGPAAGNYASDRDLGQFGGYSEQGMQDQLDQVALRSGDDGDQAQQDLLDFVNGINQYIDDVQNAAAGAEAVVSTTPGAPPRPATTLSMCARCAYAKPTAAHRRVPPPVICTKAYAPRCCNVAMPGRQKPMPPRPLAAIKKSPAIYCERPTTARCLPPPP